MNRDVREVIREEPLMRDRLLEVLRRQGPLSVAGLAAASGLPADEVMIWVAGLRKYGHLAQARAEPSGDDPRYAAAEQS